jgi:hypothetical protein
MGVTIALVLTILLVVVIFYLRGLVLPKVVAPRGSYCPFLREIIGEAYRRALLAITFCCTRLSMWWC